MHKLSLGLVFILLASGCSEEPVEEYKLSPELLAWQPYRAGDVLRFGQARSGKVRTFAIEEVDDRFESYSRGGNAPVYLGPPQRIRMQLVDVRVRRTDTLRYVRTAISTPTTPDSILFTSATALLSIGAIDNKSSFAYLNWDVGFSNTLALDQVVANQTPLDTTQRLLPTLRLGGIDYGPVLQVSNGLQSLPAEFLRTRPARRVYYAKGFGVVGFVEGSTLWYRLP